MLAPLQLSKTYRYGAAARSVRTFPFGSVIETNWPAFSSVLSGWIITVTWSPALMVVDFQPALTRALGLPISTAHKSAPPLLFPTFRSIEEWGLDHLNSL